MSPALKSTREVFPIYVYRTRRTQCLRHEFQLGNAEIAVERYERALDHMAVISAQLRTMSPSNRLTDIMALNEQTMRTTRRLIDMARQRLRLEQQRTLATAPSPRG
jgi:hypothetical protein